MVGSSAQWNKYNYMNGNVSGFLFNEFSQLTNAKEITSLTGSMSEWALLSYMARVNYSFDDKYLVTATVRRDGSSRLEKIIVGVHSFCVISMAYIQRILVSTK